jgi:DNA-binding NarL/FixJ family response regulator
MEKVMKRIRIVLADDHVLVLDAIQRMLERDFEVLGTFKDGRALVAAAPKLDPDLIVLDIHMPLMNGLSAGQRLKQRMPRVKLIYLTMSLDPDLTAEAFRIGASGYVLKSSASAELVRAINDVSQGRSYITPLITKGTFGTFSQSVKPRKDHEKLTLRQKEVLQLLAEGRSMKEVAFVLNVSPRTIAFHKYTMMEHLRVKTSAELIQFAVKSSLVAT